MAVYMKSPIFIGFVLLMFLGIAIYFRLWFMDYNFSSEDRDRMRRQFDLANKEAMDEWAEWRLKYDEEAERATTCLKELIKTKEALEKKVEEASSIDHKLAMLQKKNVDLLDRVESLNQELDAEKLKCSLQQFR
ncbi:PREDICTED: uncharacterized protein LOC104594860 [Nelumbo nucifera]|uniref:Uncharacterized protein n=2 Tax=Nelumbo nucifera TaxID=4432 RepID=A0A822Y149_NELNU|nr:PREDICTED: uncharacterized protein LOC104594860 [Nelumbo nucifera]DAD26187.1 TPA_asm: hypothetical protein HUJ06_027655 [Nelumbo nucifera]